MRAEGFFCNLDVLYEGLGIGKLYFLIQKIFLKISAVIFLQFLVIKALDQDPYWIRIGIQPKMLDPDPDEMNADPQPCLQVHGGLAEVLVLRRVARLEVADDVLGLVLQLVKLL